MNDWLEQAASEDWMERAAQDTPDPLSTSIDYGLQQNPDQFAKTKKSAEQLNLPIDVAERNPQDVNRIVQRDETIQKIEGTKWLKQAMADPDFASVAHDDVDNLVDSEKFFSSLRRLRAITTMATPTPHNVVDFAANYLLEQSDPVYQQTTEGAYEVSAEMMKKAVYRAGAGVSDIPGKLGAAVGGLTEVAAQLDRDYWKQFGVDIPQGEHWLDWISMQFRAAGRPLNESQALGKVFGFEPAPYGEGQTLSEYLRQNAQGETVTSEAAWQGLESFVTTLPGTIASILTGNPAPAVGWGMLMEGGSASEEGKKAGLDPYTNFLYFGTQGTIEGATELLPTIRLLSDLKIGSSFGKLLFNQAVQELPQEQIANFLQDMNTWLQLRPEATFGDFMRERPMAAYQTLISTIVGTSMHSGVSYGTVKLMENLTGMSYPESLGEQARAQQALRREALMQHINRLAEDSSLRERMPDVYQSHQEKVKQDVEDIYIEGEKLFQILEENGLDVDEVAKAVPSIEDQMEYVRMHGGDFRFSLEEWMTKVAGTEIGEPLTEHARFDPDDMSAFEAREWEKTAQDELLAEGDKVISELEKEEAFIQSANNVQEYFKDQLIKSGRMTRDVAEKNAALHKAFAVTMSYRNPERFPLPESVYEQYGLKITPQALPKTAQELDQLGYELMDPTEVLKSATDVPRMSDQEFADLKESIRQRGFVRPAIMIRKKDGSMTLEDGHHLVRAAQELGEQVPMQIIEQGDRSDLDVASEVLKYTEQYKTLYQEKPTFYSGLEKAVEGLKQEKGSAQQFLSMLKKQPGVKQEEIDWLGLEEYLAGKEKITKQEILDFIQNNGVQVQEVTKGEPNKELEREIEDAQLQLHYTKIDFNDIIEAEEKNRVLAANMMSPDSAIAEALIEGRYGSNELQDAAKKYYAASKAFDEIRSERPKPVKFERYQLPGGENYRELLLTLPVSDKNLPPKPEPITELPEGYGLIHNAGGTSEAYPWGEWGITDPNEVSARGHTGRYYETKEEAIQASLDRLNDEQEYAYQKQIDQITAGFKGGHFDEPNILAHIRFNERTDADGKRVLFIEEIQSDWHQTGREKGYGEPTKSEIDEKITELKNNKWEITDTVINGFKPSDDPDNQGYKTHLHRSQWGPVAKTERAAWEALAKQKLTQEIKRPPDAPFKQSWPLLAMKRMIRYAVDNGFERVAWTTGEQQAERYDLSQNIDSLTVIRSEDNTFGVKAYDKGGEVVLHDAVISEDELSDYIGKELAEKALKDLGERPPEMSEEEALNKLGDEYTKWLDSNNLPHNSADEILLNHASKLSLGQITWLNDFIERWDHVSDGGADEVSYSGVDLKVGGEGMKGFYDKMLPSMVNKYIKKWGAKTGETKLNVNNLPQEEKYTKYPESHPFSKANFPVVHAFDINAKMQESISQGQALFQKKRGVLQLPEDITKAPSVISLLEDADLSTFLHESGHFFFEVMRDMASQPGAPIQIQNDMDTLMKFVGVESLDQWNSMTFEQRRSGHEKVAEAFEVYLFEGKAPSQELHSLFQSFRAWLVNVYRQLRQYLSADKITPEVRKVFDRLLATDEAILYAERARGFVPTFKTQDEAQATDQEWKEYQRNLAASHDDAIEEVQSRALKDMQWLSGAKSRELKKLQSKANKLRKRIREQVTETVMNEPVYRAMYLFKHGKFPNTEAEPQPIKLSSKILKDLYGGPEPKKSSPDIVDPEIDDLLTAVAKLGGIDSQQAQEEGIDPANWQGKAGRTINMPVFGKRIFKRNGLSLDAMADRIAQHGYLPGLYDADDLLDKLEAALNGDAQYSNQVNYDLLYPDPDTVAWQKLVYAKLAAPEGLHPDDIAPALGFGSGDEMVRSLIDAPKMQEIINRRTDRRMMEEHGDLSNPAAIQEAANAAVHNLARSKVILTESKFLNRLAKKRTPNERAVRDAASRLIASMKVKDIKPSQFDAEERKASRDMMKAWKEGDYEKAARQSQRQLLNFHLAKQAREALDQVEKDRKYVKKFDRPVTRKSIDWQQMEQIDALRASFDFTNITLKEIERRQSLHEWILNAEHDGFDPAIDPDQLELLRLQNYKTMTLEEMRGLIDGIKNIEHVGRLKKKLLTAEDKRLFAERIAEAAASIEENANRTVKERATPTDIVGRAGRWARGWAAIHRKFASIIREMDGSQDGGVMWDLLSRSMNEAGDTETEMRNTVSDRMAKLFAPINKKIARGGLPFNIYTQRRQVPGTKLNMSYEERVMFGMNWGNEGNRQRLLDGGLSGKSALSEQDAVAILNSLDKQDWDFIQGVLDYIEEFKPAIAEQERKLTGVTPEWIEATPIETKYGVYRGGYFPAKYDAYQSSRSQELEAVTNLRQAMKGAFNAAATKKGYTMKRAEEVKGRPLLLSFNAISQHINEVTHRLAWQDWLTDVNRVLRALDEPIRRHYGPEILRELKQTVRDIADGDAQGNDEMERLINHVRIGTTISGMGWRVLTAAIQPTGMAQSWVRIGGKWLAKGTAQYMKNPIKANKQASAESRLMRDRERTYMREVNEVMNVARAGKKLNAVTASYFTLIYKMQRMVDVPTYWGAKEKALEQLKYEEAVSETQRKAIEKKAISMAEQAVIDAQSGGQLKDLARIQRGGPLMKLWTNFYSYFSATYNLNIEAFRRTNPRSASSLGMLAVDLMILNVVPVLMAVAIRELFKGDCEDPECWAQKLAKEQSSYLFGQMVLLREFGEISNYFITGKGYGYQGPPGIRILGEIYRLGQQAAQGEADAAFFKAANSVAGILLHYPSGQIQATVEGFNAIHDGEVSGWGAVQALVAGPPK